MPVSNSLADAIILRDGLMRHHKVTYVVGKGILWMILVDHGQFNLLNGFLKKSLSLGFLFKPLEIDIKEVFIVWEHMPYGNKYFTGDCHLYFHFRLTLDGALHIWEVGEEAVACSRCCPGNFNQYLSEELVAVGDFVALDFTVALVVARSESAPRTISSNWNKVG